MGKRKFAALASSLRKEQSLQKKTKNKSQEPSQSNKKALGKRTARSLIPFAQEDSLLFVGEGNFSFAASCVETHLEHAENVTATSLDTLETLAEKYSGVKEHISTIQDCCGTVLHGIDGTMLEKHFGLDFDVVLFLFPHVAAGIADETRNVQTNQKMLLGFFKSVQHVLKPGGTVAVTLATNKTYDLWDLKGLAKSTGLAVKTSGVFDGSQFPGYTHARTGGNNKNDTGFSGGKGEERSARWTIFMRASDAAQASKQKRQKDEIDEDD